MNMFRKTFLVAALIAGLVPAAVAQLSNADKTFVMKAAKSNNYEIQAAKLAQQNSTNDAYKSYADMIISDHTKAGDELKSAVSQANPSVTMPTDVSAKQQQHLDALKSAGDKFDSTYRHQMIATHMAALKLAQNYVAEPDANGQIKQVAQGLIPVFQRHLADAKKLPKQ
jgi:putative membrane protein